MKIFKTIPLLLIIFSFSESFSQEINWRTLNTDSKHFVLANFGADYSSYYGLSYGYNLKNRLTPIVIGTEFNLSFGKDVFDDWKSRTSIQAELWQSGNLSWVTTNGGTVTSVTASTPLSSSGGATPNISGKWFKPVLYNVDPKTYLIDYDQIEALALEHKPKLIIAGFSCYTQPLDFARFREIADKVGAYLMADIAHIAGLRYRKPCASS